MIGETDKVTNLTTTFNKGIPRHDKYERSHSERVFPNV